MDEDNKTWLNQYNKSNVLLKSYKLDALMTASYLCYLGIFDAENRDLIVEKWNLTLGKLKNDINTTKYILRSNYSFKEIVINPFEYKDLMIQLNKLGIRDEYFMNNALFLREFCALPTTMSWPLLFDPENISLKLISSTRIN